MRYEIGVDEVGRGAWAGPLVAAAVLFHSEPIILPERVYIRDSKKLSEIQRERSSDYIRNNARHAIGIVSVEEIDHLGIQEANRHAFYRAVEGLVQQIPYKDRNDIHVLLDGRRICTFSHSHQFIVNGDSIHQSIAAASIIAKTFRDTIMRDLGTQYPYFFEDNKGYGTKQHQEALAVKGPCVHHRQSFQPIRLLLAQEKK